MCLEHSNSPDFWVCVWGWGGGGVYSMVAAAEGKMSAVGYDVSNPGTAQHNETVLPGLLVGAFTWSDGQVCACVLRCA